MPSRLGAKEVRLGSFRLGEVSDGSLSSLPSWPSLPVPSIESYFDHFNSSLNSRWTPVVSGSGSQSVTDSYLELLSPASSAAFVYLNTKIDKTKSQLITFAVSAERVSGSGPLQCAAYLLNGSGVPAAATDAAIQARTIARIDYGGDAGGLTAAHPMYWNNSNVQQFFHRPNDVWQSAYPGSNANLAIPYARYDDYYIYGIEIDAVNSRWRTHVWCQSYPTPGTYTWDQGLRLMATTPFVTFANTRVTDDIWLVLGRASTDHTNSWTLRIEWLRHAIARSGNKVYDGWAQENPSAGSGGIRHIYSYDMDTWLLDRSAYALTVNPSAGTIDDFSMSGPFVVYDGVSTDYMFYTGFSSAWKGAICLASATHVAAETGQSATFTRYGSNPLLDLGASGAFDDDQLMFPYVIKDENELNVNKRWKMLYSGGKVSDGKHRLGYATAPAATGPWTKQGMVLDVGGSGAPDEGNIYTGAIVRYAGVWEVYYEGADASGNRKMLRATGTDLGVLTKDGASYYTPPVDGDTALTANLTTAPGRTVTVSNTTGFVPDGVVLIDQDNVATNYAVSRVRKIISSTVLELYHGLTGFMTTTPARIRMATRTKRFSPRGIYRIGNEWCFMFTVWGGFDDLNPTYGAFFEESMMLKHSELAPSGANPTVQYLTSPLGWRHEYGSENTFENLSFLNTPLAADPIATIYLDDFNRADQVGLGTPSGGGTWTANPSGLGSPYDLMPDIVGNQAMRRAALGAGYSYAYHSQSLNATCGCGFAIGGRTGELIAALLITANVGTTSKLGYEFDWQQDAAGVWGLYRLTGTTETLIANGTAPPPIAAGTILRMRLTPTAVVCEYSVDSGSSWTTLTSTPDTTHRSAATKAGFVVGRNTSPGAIYGAIDNFFVEGVPVTTEFGAVTMPLDFGVYIDGQAVAPPVELGQLDLPISFGASVDGQAVAPPVELGQLDLPISFGASVDGQAVGPGVELGQLALPISFGASVDGQAVAPPAVIEYGSVTMPLQLRLRVSTGEGSTILNDAVAIYLGNTPVVAVYTDNQQVWP